MEILFQPDGPDFFRDDDLKGPGHVRGRPRDLAFQHQPVLESPETVSKSLVTFLVGFSFNTYI